MTKQREYQKRMRAAGRCTQCGERTEPSTRKGQTHRRYCDRCNSKINDRQRFRTGARRRNKTKYETTKYTV